MPHIQIDKNQQQQQQQQQQHHQQQQQQQKPIGGETNNNVTSNTQEFSREKVSLLVSSDGICIWTILTSLLLSFLIPFIPFIPAYGVGHVGTIALTKVQAREMKKDARGILVNAVSVHTKNNYYKK